MSAPILLAIRLALIVALYAFLGWALYTLWKDLKQRSQAVSAPSVPALSLAPQAQGERPPMRFLTPQVIIGRDPACDCRLEDKTISGQHARLSYHHAQWWVEDLNSTNGTFLNGEPVLGAVVATSGDQLRCGGVDLQVQIGSFD